MMVVLVSTREEGLTIFPTHRLAQDVNGVRGTPIDEPGDELPGVVLYRAAATSCSRATGSTSSSSTRSRRRASPTRRSRDEAVAAVDRGEAEAAFLLRPTTIEDGSRSRARAT
jgi:hypothetical protein